MIFPYTKGIAKIKNKKKKLYFNVLVGGGECFRGYSSMKANELLDQ